METLLIVDDDQSLLESLKMHFEDIEKDGAPRFHVVTATNASEALERLNADPAIDLLFTDVVMPGGISGLSLARTARELRPGLRVLLTSGFVGEDRVSEGREFPLLDKPYEAAVLATTLRKLLDRPERRSKKRAPEAAE